MAKHAPSFSPTLLPGTYFTEGSNKTATATRWHGCCGMEGKILYKGEPSSVSISGPLRQVLRFSLENKKLMLNKPFSSSF